MTQPAILHQLLGDQTPTEHSRSVIDQNAVLVELNSTAHACGHDTPRNYSIIAIIRISTGLRSTQYTAEAALATAARLAS